MNTASRWAAIAVIVVVHLALLRGLSSPTTPAVSPVVQGKMPLRLLMIPESEPGEVSHATSHAVRRLRNDAGPRSTDQVPVRLRPVRTVRVPLPAEAADRALRHAPGIAPFQAPMPMKIPSDSDSPQTTRRREMIEPRTAATAGLESRPAATAGLESASSTGDASSLSAPASANRPGESLNLDVRRIARELAREQATSERQRRLPIDEAPTRGARLQRIFEHHLGRPVSTWTESPRADGTILIRFSGGSCMLLRPELLEAGHPMRASPVVTNCP